MPEAARAKPFIIGTVARPSGPAFISVAFTAALLCGPLVVATGLLTGSARSLQPSPVDLSGPVVGSVALRQSFDADPPALRPSEN